MVPGGLRGGREGAAAAPLAAEAVQFARRRAAAAAAGGRSEGGRWILNHWNTGEGPLPCRGKVLQNPFLSVTIPGLGLSTQHSVQVDAE